MIGHHLDDATVIAYAAGSLNEALSVAVATHLAMCGRCRRAVRLAEAAGGAMLDRSDASDLAPESFARMMDRIDAAAGAADAVLHSAPKVADSRVPAPLARRLKCGLDDIRWRWIAPGVYSYDLPVGPDGGQLKLLKIGSGKAMPEHGHGGAEITLVLDGSYRDETGHYGPGDVADLDEDIEHAPVVDSDVPCICLVATEAPARFKSLLARALQPYFRI
jgi:putative transcriptional regulator